MGGSAVGVDAEYNTHPYTTSLLQFRASPLPAPISIQWPAVRNEGVQRGQIPLCRAWSVTSQANAYLPDPNIPFPTGGIRSCEDYKQFLIGFHTALPGHNTIEDPIDEGVSARDVEIAPCPAIRS